VAQAVGRQDFAAADRVASAALTVSVALGLLFLAAGVLAGRLMLRALGAQGEVLEHAWAYFQVISFTVPLFFVSASLRAVLAGEGDAKTPMYIFGAATVINLSLDAIFIFGLGWGVRGAALAVAPWCGSAWPGSATTDRSWRGS
jgi:Na+-driven multidrug efflux pump